MFACWKGLSLKHLGLKKGGFRRCLRFEWNTFEVAFLNVATPVVKSEWNLVSAGNEDFMVGKFHCIQVPGRPWGRHHKKPTRYSRNGRKKALQRNKAGKVNAYRCVSTSDTPKSRRNSWFYLGSSCFGSCLILRHSHFSYCMKSYTYVKMDSDIYRWWKIPNSGWERGILHLFQYALRYLHAPPVKKRGFIHDVDLSTESAACSQVLSWGMTPFFLDTYRIDHHVGDIRYPKFIPVFIQICIKMSIPGYNIMNL